LVADSPKSATKINISLSEMALLVKKRQNFSRLTSKTTKSKLPVSKKKGPTRIRKLYFFNFQSFCFVEIAVNVLNIHNRSCKSFVPQRLILIKIYGLYNFTFQFSYKLFSCFLRNDSGHRCLFRGLQSIGFARSY
jgi:hypothetical protein